jgi:hypothetical protein
VVLTVSDRRIDIASCPPQNNSESAEQSSRRRNVHGTRTTQFARRWDPRQLHALALLFGVLLGTPADGAWVSGARHGVPDHDCACGTCSGRSCCCAKRAAANAARESRALRVQGHNLRTSSGPCMGATPCDNDGLPTAPPGYRLSRASALNLVDATPHSADREAFPLPVSDRPPLSNPSRLDRPPKVAA